MVGGKDEGGREGGASRSLSRFLAAFAAEASPPPRRQIRMEGRQKKKEEGREMRMLGWIQKEEGREEARWDGWLPWLLLPLTPSFFALFLLYHRSGSLPPRVMLLCCLNYRLLSEGRRPKVVRIAREGWNSGTSEWKGGGRELAQHQVFSL